MSIGLLLLVAAFILFVIAALNVSSRINLIGNYVVKLSQVYNCHLIAAGLACATLSFILPHI